MTPRALAVTVWLVGVVAVLGGMGRYDATVEAARLRVSPSFRSPFVLSSHAPAGSITNVYGGPGSESNSDIATDAKGNWLVVWHSTDPLGGAIGRDWDILVSRSSDRGATWSEHAVLNTNAGNDSGDDLSPTLTSDGAGLWVAAWTSTETVGGRYGLDRDVFFARSLDNGATWSVPAPLNTNADGDWGDDSGVRLACDSKGNWVAVWASTETLGARVGGDRDVFVSRSSDGAVSWTEPMPLNTNAHVDKGFDVTPDVVSDGQGRWLAVWSSGDSREGRIGADRDILIARSEDNGASWSDPSRLSSNTAGDKNSDRLPKLATDRRGNWVAVWSSAATFGGTIGYDRDILVSRSTNNGAGWTRAAPLNANASSDSREDSAPNIVTDGAGKWVTVWHSWGGLSYTDGSDADIMVSYSDDGGQGWSPPSLINRAGARDSVDDLLPGLALDDAGHLVAIWQSFYPATGAVAQAEWRVISSAGSIEEISGPPPAVR